MLALSGGEGRFRGRVITGAAGALIFFPNGILTGGRGAGNFPASLMNHLGVRGLEMLASARKLPLAMDK